MASTTVTDTPIHPSNLALVEDLAKNIDHYPDGRNNNNMLKFVSIYAPIDDMTYTNHVMYSVLGHSVSEIPLPTAGALVAENKFIASNGAVIEAIDRDGACEIIGTKLNGTRKMLPTDTSLAYDIPPFPSVRLSPNTLYCLNFYDADAKLFQAPTWNSDAMAQMFDFRLEDGQGQILVHPAEVIYRTRQLFREPIKSDDAAVQAAIIAEVQQIYTCAVAIVTAFQEDDDQGESARVCHFRQAMREKWVNVTSVDKNVIKEIVPPSGLEEEEDGDYEADDGKGIEDDLWFLRELLTDWALMTSIILLAVRNELEEDIDFELMW